MESEMDKTEVPTSESDPEISAIITCYYEEKSIEEFHSRLSKALQTLGRTYEIIFVNDGSTDKTFEKLKAILENHSHVTAVIDLFKNAGQAAAITAGICHAGGRILLFMDSDLQLAPEELPLLVNEYNKGYDVVSGYRKHRRDSLFRILPSKTANVIMRKASNSKLSDFGCTFKLFNAELVRAFEFGSVRVFNPVSVIAKAGRCCEVPVTHFPRKYGKSGWTFRKLWQYNMEHLVNLSARPFQLLAVVSLVFALLFLVRVVLGPLMDFEFLKEVSNGLLLNAIVISALIVVGILCIIGEFAIRSFIASQKPPQYIVKEVVRRSSVAG